MGDSTLNQVVPRTGSNLMSCHSQNCDSHVKKSKKVNHKIAPQSMAGYYQGVRRSWKRLAAKHTTQLMTKVENEGRREQEPVVVGHRAY